jgi:hypothetical protein
MTSPAPNRPRLLAPLRLEPVRDDTVPIEPVRLPRTESGLPDVCDVRPAPDEVTGSVRTGPVADADDDDTDADSAGAGTAATATGAGVAAGAMPQTSQKPSSMVPVHPGLRHAVMALAPSRRSPAGTC